MKPEGNWYVATCETCGWERAETYPHILGGEDTLENLRTLCKPCNSSKGARV